MTVCWPLGPVDLLVGGASVETQILVARYDLLHPSFAVGWSYDKHGWARSEQLVVAVVGANNSEEV